MRRTGPSRHLDFGALPSSAEFANPNLFGYDTAGGLSDLTLSSPTAPEYNPFESYQHQPSYVPSNAPSLDLAFHRDGDAMNSQGYLNDAHRGQHGNHWQGGLATSQRPIALPSPPLLSANSMNLLPLYSQPEHDLPQQFSAYATSDHAALPDVPYAESAASAASSNLSPLEDEYGPRPPLDEEKRKRNLAASARFRQKKKLREQQFERQTKELGDRACELETRIAELEKENNFLKALLTEKETDMTPEGRRRFKEFAAMVESGEY